MIPITKADDDLFGTAVLATRLGRAGPLIEHLRKRYHDEWDDPMAGVPFALAMFALVQSGRTEISAEFNFTDIIETFGDLLYDEPNHWLGRYLRIHARTLLPTDGEYQNYMVAERVRAAEDVQELIDRQSRTAWQPWFTCTYITAARLAWQTNPADLDAIAGLVTAAAELPCAPVRFPSLGSVLCSSFFLYYDQPELPERDTVGALMGLIFPDHLTVKRERADRLA
jgi:hypothetical protein